MSDGASQVVLVVKKPPVNARDAGSIPGSGRSPREGNGNPLQYCCLENATDREICRYLRGPLIFVIIWPRNTAQEASLGVRAGEGQAEEPPAAVLSIPQPHFFLQHKIAASL